MSVVVGMIDESRFPSLPEFEGRYNVPPIDSEPQTPVFANHSAPRPVSPREADGVRAKLKRIVIDRYAATGVSRADAKKFAAFRFAQLFPDRTVGLLLDDFDYPSPGLIRAMQRLLRTEYPLWRFAINLRSFETSFLVYPELVAFFDRKVGVDLVSALRVNNKCEHAVRFGNPTNRRWLKLVRLAWHVATARRGPLPDWKPLFFADHSYDDMTTWSLVAIRSRRAIRADYLTEGCFARFYPLLPNRRLGAVWSTSRDARAVLEFVRLPDAWPTKELKVRLEYYEPLKTKDGPVTDRVYLLADVPSMTSEKIEAEVSRRRLREMFEL